MSGSARTEETGLIQDFLSGDPSALRVVDGWIEVVLRQGHSSLQREWDDLRQEVRARVFRNLSRGDFNGRSALRTYVHRIARNVCIDSIRRARLDRPVDDSESILERRGAIDPASSAYMAREMLARLLEGLTDEERRLLHMVHVEQRSYADLARFLGVSEGAVKLRVFRTRRRLLQRRHELMEPKVEGP